MTAPLAGGAARSASRADPVSAGLRHAAANAADLARGVALVFARNTADPRAGGLALRAAAGFASPEDARVAARAVEAFAREASGAPELVRTSLPSLGSRAVSGVLGVPLTVEERAWGALIVGATVPLDERGGAALGALAQSAALCLDHAHLGARVAALEKDLAEHSVEPAGDASDEVLKLSEALFAQDIELLRKSEQLGKVEKLKSDFIEKMSRELRTPLNSIIEAIIAVLAGENEHLSEPAKASLRAALDDGTSFQRTLQNILDLWRIKQGELPVQTQEVNFREVVEEAIFSVQDAIGAKPVAIERLLPDPLPKFRTDLAKVNQILFLLLDNAVKFTPSGTIQIEVVLKTGELRCSVRDTGIGICADDRQYVFDEFFQVEDASSLRYRGAGLGLTLVRELVALLGGSIELESEVGQGTTVTFSVPVQSLAA
jgi:signal transduction histidine kinase